MKRFITNLFFFTVLLFLGLASLYGVLVPDNVPVKTVGVMQLSAFKNGLSLYQANRPYYYSMSAYNDYFLLADGNRSVFLSKEEIKDNRFTTNFHTSHTKDIANAILAYFNAANPQISFYGENKEIEYDTESSNNALIITRRVKANGNNPQVLGTTFTYYGIDFIYDKSGNLYAYQSEEELANFARFYGVVLNLKTEEFRIPIPDKTAVIVSPYLAGAIVVRANDNQTLWVNRNTKMIEVEEQANPQDGYYTTSLTVEVYENPKEAQRAL